MNFPEKLEVRPEDLINVNYTDDQNCVLARALNRYINIIENHLSIGGWGRVWNEKNNEVLVRYQWENGDEFNQATHLQTGILVKCAQK